MTNYKREEINLSGIWQIAFDPDNEGVQKFWMGDGWPQAQSHPVQVPGIWNISYPDAEGIGFYRMTFTVPGTWHDRIILLRFAGAIYRSDVWVNGKFLGSHEGGYTPFEFDITHAIQTGSENLLVVRVAGLSKTKAIDGIKLIHTPLSKQSWYYVYGGVWGQVTLEACPIVACQSFKIDPYLHRESVNLELSIHNRREECRQVEILIDIRDPRGTQVFDLQNRVPVPPGEAAFNYPVHIPRPMPWSCEQPDLYHLDFKVVDEDGHMDFRQADFGMRDFTVQEGQFFLNGEPIYIRGILLQPNFPVNLIDHPDREMMVREITLMKEAGFNLIRVHLQPPSPGYLEIADQMGMLIYAETSLGWIKDNPRLVDHGRREIQAMIALARNHPSVVFWGVYNENPTASAINGEELARFARTLDPTRVIVEDSGGSLAIDQDFGWIDRAAVTPAWEVQPQRILDVHLYVGSPTPGSIIDWMNVLGTGASSRVLVDEAFGSLPVVDEFDRECRSYRGQVFVSEIGCGGMADLDDQVAGFGGREDLLDARELKTLRDSLRSGFQERHLDRIFGSRRKLFLEAQEVQAIGNTQQLESLISNPRVSGYSITQLNDCTWEFHAGLLDLWRNPKPAYFAAQRINQPHVLILRPASPCAAVGETVSVALTMVNQQALHPEVQLHVAVIDPANKAVSNRQLQLPVQPGIHPLERLNVDIPVPGTYRVAARLMLNGNTLAETSETILALEKVAWDELRISAWGLGQLPDPAIIPCLTPGSTGILPASSGAQPAVCLAAYPATLALEDWETLLKAVETGTAAIVGALRPENSAAISALTRRGLNPQLHMGIGSWMGCYHWAPQSDLFAGLPAGGLVKKPFTGIIPKYVLSEMGGEVLAGSLRNTQSRLEAPAMLWYSDIEVIRLGKGAILFCQYRVFDHLTTDPLAARLAYNLLVHAGRLAAS